MRRLLLSLLLVLPAVAFGQVRRCDLPTGGTVYTDRRCDSLGAQDHVQRPAAPQLRSYRPACPRTLRDLAYEVTAAIEAHDVNRLAGVYLWSGVSTRDGYALMDRLQAVADRPLVDLQPVYPGGMDEALAPTRPPIALRVEQTSIRGTTPIHAIFGLRKHLECWWIVEGGARRVTPLPSTDATPTDAAPDPVPSVD